jgi:AraC-like DNA-binding protein
MIQLQRLNPQVTNADGFSQPGIRSYHEYLVLAKLPEVEGVSERVLQALQRRVGHAPMAIEYIASDLNLSKRTLQRRLQQQEASFAQLRDSLRFHYAIQYLIDDHMSVDSVSSSLDFSDRTSFTNAFKRWTNLSPSVFRKLFRDYA